MNTFIKKCLSLFLAISATITVGALSYGVGIAAEESMDSYNADYTTIQSSESVKKGDTFAVINEGKNLVYKVTSTESNTVEVASNQPESLTEIIVDILPEQFKGYKSIISKFLKNFYYSGEIVVPSTVDYNGSTYKVTSIGNSAFKYCDNIEKVDIPDSVTVIKNSAFYSCESLDEITIPSSVKAIGDWAFFNCVELKNVYLSEGVVNIGEHCFFNCMNLMNINFPTSLKNIGECAFGGCKSLNTIEITSSDINISNNAFVYCTNLETVNCTTAIPPTIGNNVFKDCSPNLKVYVPIGSRGAYILSGWPVDNLEENQLS